MADTFEIIDKNPANFGPRPTGDIPVVSQTQVKSFGEHSGKDID